MTLHAQALAALTHWGPLARPPVLVKHRENAVFDTLFADGTRAALRLHRPGYQTRAAILSELAWCADLCARGFPAAEPLPTRAGALCTDGPQIASVVRWIDGAPIDVGGGLPRRIGLHRSVGTLLARLHDAADVFRPGAGFVRPRWDADGLLGPAPFWGRFWDSRVLSDTESALFGSLRADLRPCLADLPTGLIHADAIRDNILAADTTLYLIDFDDCGSGFRLYDLATALVQGLEDPDHPAYAAALLDGYGRIRPLPADAARNLTLFCLLRACAAIGWLADRADASDPRHRFHTDRALRLARLWRAGGTVCDPLI